jgi:hypothetical protein
MYCAVEVSYVGWDLRIHFWKPHNVLICCQLRKELIAKMGVALCDIIMIVAI